MTHTSARTRIAAILSGGALALTVMAVAPAQASSIGNEGCTPGYWKNHTDNWWEAPGIPIRTDKLLIRVYDVSEPLRGDTFLDALNYGGGPGVLGAEKILMRAAVAAWLNAAHEDLGYPYRRISEPYNIEATVNAALASGDRATMLAVAAELDAANNLGCPLS